MTNQKHCPDLGRELSLVWNFCACCSGVILWRNQWVIAKCWLFSGAINDHLVLFLFFSILPIYVTELSIWSFPKSWMNFFIGNNFAWERKKNISWKRLSHSPKSVIFQQNWCVEVSIEYCKRKTYKKLFQSNSRKIETHGLL